MNTERRRLRVERLSGILVARDQNQQFTEMMQAIEAASFETRDLIYAELENRTEEEREKAKRMSMGAVWAWLFDEPSPGEILWEHIRPLVE